MRRSHPLTLLAAAVVAAVLAGTAAPVAQASSGREGTKTVTLLLAPKDRATLRAMASRHATPSAAALRAALPSSQAYRAVRDLSSALGLRVVRSSRWAVQLQGPASTMNRVFAPKPARGKLGRSLLSTPSGLSRYVSLSLDASAGRGLFHHFANPLAPSGDNLRASVGGGPRFVPASGAPRPTVATVQLSDWNASDLTTYVAAAKAAAVAANDPVAFPSTVSLTQVNDAFAPAVYDPNDSVEVDLDQEALFAVAPYAKQRLYKSENQLFGMLDSLYTIGDDALSSSDDNIVAASVSWGTCESDIGTDAAAAAVYSTFEDALSYLALAGVTVFAASGDFGLKCTGPTQSSDDVSLPASSPRVIAVGGVNGGIPSDTTPLSSWDLANDPMTPADDRAGSGGGSSSVYVRPAYQSALTSASPMRQLPDIAALAGDPGFDTYSTTLGWYRVGGTSLAAPVAAGGLANALALAGHPWGVGDLLPTLYGANGALPGGSFADVTVQGDGGATGSGAGLAADTAAGYDNATGLGVPNWQAILGSSAMRGIPHLTPASRWVKTTSVPVTIHRSLGSHPGARFRVVDTQYGTPDCSVSVGEVSNPAAIPPFDVTGGDSGYPAGYYDGDYLLAVVERDGPDCLIGYRSVTVDTESPTVTTPLIRPSSGGKAVVTWSASDKTSGVSGYTVTLRRYTPTGSAILSQTVASTATGAYTFTPVAGAMYVAYVQAKDRAGNVSSYRPSVRTTLIDDAAFSYSPGWARATSTGDFLNGSHYTSQRGRTATVANAYGRIYYVLVRTGPAYGKATVSIGGSTRTIDLYSATFKQRVLSYVFYGSPASRSLVVKSLGARNSRSKGYTVVLDGLLVTS